MDYNSHSTLYIYISFSFHFCMMLNFLENLISIITEHETFMGAYTFMYRNSDPSAWNAHGYVPFICRNLIPSTWKNMGIYVLKLKESKSLNMKYLWVHALHLGVIQDISHNQRLHFIIFPKIVTSFFIDTNPLLYLHFIGVGLLHVLFSNCF